MCRHRYRSVGVPQKKSPTFRSKYQALQKQIDGRLPQNLQVRFDFTMKTPQQWIMVGATLAALAVVFGAFGAHGLEPRLNAVYGDQEKSIAGHTVPATYKYFQDFRTGPSIICTMLLGCWHLVSPRANMLKLAGATGSPRGVFCWASFCFPEASMCSFCLECAGSERSPRSVVR